MPKLVALETLWRLAIPLVVAFLATPKALDLLVRLSLFLFRSQSTFLEVLLPVFLIFIPFLNGVVNLGTSPTLQISEQAQFDHALMVTQ